MEKNNAFKTIVFFLLAAYLLQPMACAIRTTVASFPSASTSQDSIEVDPPPPSLVFEKRLPSRPSGLENPKSPGILGTARPEEGRLAGFNDYLSTRISFKAKKLTGMDHFLNVFLDLTQHVIAGVAVIAVLDRSGHK